MNKIITLFALSAILVGCSHKGFHKRQYKNRMWINHGFSKTDEATVDKIPQFNVESSPELQKFDLNFEELELKNQTTVETSSEEETTANKSDAEIKNVAAKEIQKEEQLQNLEKRSDIQEKNQVAPKANKNILEVKKEQDVESGLIIVLLVILALIIPPLAVLLYEGATNRFLLNLILCLLYLLVFYNPLAGLLGLIAVIHAILIVLGII